MTAARVPRTVVVAIAGPPREPLARTPPIPITSMLRAPLLVAALAATFAATLAGCVTPVRMRHDTKRVAKKDGDYTLVAADGTRCMVPAPTFDATSVGDEVACAWRNR